ncbi:hypothetical protein RESH_05823 [Rhodopirellula europaea SH398]|uniref:Uncharacterized protein n=1 Tax=Rhodopirellula europaea SH398 TaxID=1263868 RepID=M5S7D8_9BACT|nr:hypothetical protein RESH_05823 [Rhodopirellula europaea SH398]
MSTGFFVRTLSGSRIFVFAFGFLTFLWFVRWASALGPPTQNSKNTTQIKHFEPPR